MLVYRATPEDVESGVRVGDVEYPGFPASRPARVRGRRPDPGFKVAFFALLPDQDLNTPIVAFARDEAGNEAHATFVDNVFKKPFKQSRIELDDRFINRVVPEILDHSPELKLPSPAAGTDLLPAFLKINGELRRMNDDQIAALAAQTSPVAPVEGSVRPARQLAGRGCRSRTIARTSTRARKSIGRCIWASISR